MVFPLFFLFFIVLLVALIVVTVQLTAAAIGIYREHHRRPPSRHA